MEVDVYPELADRTHEIRSWEDVFLRASADRLLQWDRSGLLCIGDAVHAKSPAGGVGINVAIQDAIAAVNMLGPILRRGNSPAVEETAAG